MGRAVSLPLSVVHEGLIYSLSYLSLMEVLTLIHINYTNMASFDIIRYMSSLTGYIFDDAVLERIALERSVADVASFSEITEKDKDLLTADLLFVLYTSPSQSASFSKKHGQFSQSVGSQTITDKDGIYNLMMRLYNKWEDPKAKEVENMGGGLEWMQ